MFRFAPEGYPPIFVFLFITIVVAFFAEPWVAMVLLGVTFFILFFFRDPERSIPQGDNIFVSPADGKVILIQNVHEERYLKNDATQVSIFMSPFNVHVNRSPCDAIVKLVVYTPGRFLSAFKPEASRENENITMLLETENAKVLVRQVAGFIARRAVCRVKPGDTLKRGERYGIIKFGSRLDVYLPLYTEIKVKLGDKVKGGESILGVRI